MIVTAAHGTGPWAVVLGSHKPYEPVAAWGPFTNWDEASQFCQYVTAEIDPAVILTLQSPAAEMLLWRTNVALPAMRGEEPDGKPAGG